MKYITIFLCVGVAVFLAWELAVVVTITLWRQPQLVVRDSSVENTLATSGTLQRVSYPYSSDSTTLFIPSLKYNDAYFQFDVSSTPKLIIYCNGAIALYGQKIGHLNSADANYFCEIKP